MKILSLFNGISCGMAALERAGIPVERYVSFEIDKYANTVTAKNYPQIELRGDVKTVDFTEFEGFDLVLGGFPCQDLSVAKRDRKGLDGERSGLLSELVRAISEAKPKYFLAENVASMKNAERDRISEILGVEPILINSALVSAQNRKRYYWTNIPNVGFPEDKGILLKDILETNVDRRYYFSEAGYRSWENTKRRIKEQGLSYRYEPIKPPYEVKAACIDANYHKGADGKRPMIQEINGEYRVLTPIECERLQTLPDNYTAGISNTRRYKALGNGWTVDVIAHILRHIPKENTCQK